MKRVKPEFPGYRSSGGNSAGGSAGVRSICMWPACGFFAVTEIRQGMWGNPSQWTCLCTEHRRDFDLLSWSELKEMPWSRRVKRAVGFSMAKVPTPSTREGGV